MGRPQRSRSARPAPQLPVRYIVFALGFVLILFGLYRMFAVTSIEVVAPSRVNEIRAEAMNLKQGSIRQGNLVLLDSGAFERTLKAMDPLILNVEVRRKWFHTLKLTVNLKQPGLGWTTGNQRYLVDRDGTVIDMLPEGTSLPVVTDNSNLPVKIGQRIVTGKFVAFVSDISPKVVASGYKITKIEVRETTLDLYVTTDKGYQLIFDTSRAASEEIADLRGVQATLAAQRRTPIAYIDLRIPSKAYYK
jgi:cell division septal protein FtsQ